MKKRFLTALAVCSPVMLYAQNLRDSLNTVLEEWIEPAFPIVAALVFLIGVGTNLGKFMGEDRDVKKGITNILIFLVVILAIGGIYSIIKAQSL